MCIRDRSRTDPNSGPIYVLDGEIKSKAPLQILECHRGSSHCIAIDPQGKYFATGATDAIVALWDVQEMYVTKTFSGNKSPLRQLSFSYDGRYLAMTSEESKVSIVDINEEMDYYQEDEESKEPVYEISFNCAQNAVSWHPNYHLLATADGKTKGESDVCIHLFGAVKNV
eukprot:TRINITY_DN6335_c0_g1_i18.p1 TRINITY_DN6335_c0_g1~~TRINITY_DN6335_c0_g1_i18.p1  ORF type:complete len:170 (+),score=24.07 TRINITY_DN6335_c0_g1_i18:64-573(+)